MKPSRAMIPGELSWAFVAFCFAYAGSGFWPGSMIHTKLAMHASPFLWCLLLGVPAIWLMFVSTAEWVAHRRGCSDPKARWTIFETDRSAMIRGRLCLALVLGWLYMLYVVLADFDGAIVSTGLSAGGSLFMLWFYKENRRVRREIRHGTVAAPA